MLYTHNQKLVSSVENDEFLPPISPWTSLAGIFLLGTVAVGITLSSWVKYNVTVKAEATVRPTGEIRVVQPEMDGTIKSILVKENQVVKKGDVIAHLDTEQVLIKKTQMQGNIQQSSLQIIQIDSQIRILNSQILAEKEVIKRIVASAKADLLRNKREYQERKINTQNEFLSTEAGLQKAKTDLQKAQADLEFAKLDRDRYEQLSQIGAIGRREFEQKQLVVQQTQLTLQAQQKSYQIAKIKVKSAKAAVNPTTAMVMIAQERIAQETAKGQGNIASLNKEKQALIERRLQLQTQIQQFQKELQQIENQLKKSILSATNNGIILKLNLRNPGQVVRASESIAEIVPNNASLVIKAMIPTAEIKKVAVGQKVQLRVNSCPYPDYGTLKGVVENISPDIIPTQSNNSGILTSSGHFEATIQPEKLEFGNSNHQCHIQSGMEVKTDIISREETALKFMLRKARLITDL
ncbi:HlyD family efflux transporter periplasmic adaptor subunit [Anabaena cylindrica FACHB-243]|uniref:Secretion protein HlyD family protein n=1 Tax=Anabaena cylindrica (strain ATCC 27899 / PCC 7122) TaxID=272123 RepID=K9ZMB7_ANACC|nr:MULTISPECIES: HlyD family efflux transporter periplasmic adaptor subunit [Anabaena]AFZ60341.1 secretion protein HlyD family protein [Anabaena cylindrica PCC 7122]MBD2418933.1 HlyD family efflux transporter periplasmic adaptor subunit [Anabaena cylindrica FACHB-243]MBY5285052.1 HlyD family efflux transporter periplasmic adaptor subunit [Anabaena sp. CCAP 1446/1C]MBY5310898.1 HlyD family efflux transporter periplasmic adaptor subunit [Anabaena sp. CCAP 1446/1C]MCM2404524.1 HlyD family efflux 